MPFSAAYQEEIAAATEEHNRLERERLRSKPLKEGARLSALQKLGEAFRKKQGK